MEIVLRTFCENDIDFALQQTAREGWDTTPTFFGTCLEHDPEGCFIAEQKGKRVGMVTTTRYTESAWIGNLIVVPESRSQGIGAMILNHAMEYLAEEGVRTIRLEADPPGIKLYRRVGFRDEFEAPRFRALLANFDLSNGSMSPSVQSLPAKDFDTITSLDKEFFGDDRSKLLRHMYDSSQGAFRFVEGGLVQGYLFLQLSTSGVRIGPLIARNGAIARTLLLRGLREASVAEVVVALPAMNEGAMALFKSLGFERSPSSFRMVHGSHACVGNPQGIFAIGNGATG